MKSAREGALSQAAYPWTFLHADNQGQSRETWGGNCQLDWNTLLTYISGAVDEEILLRNEDLVAENRILCNQIKRRVQLSGAERQTLAKIGNQTG